jgi:oligoendopeptidase F
MPLAVDLDTYAAQAEEFVGAMDREYYRHFAGHKPEFEIQPIYERHAGLFTRDVVDQLRERLAAAAPGDETRRSRYLLELAVGGLLGNETKEEETALAEREAALEIEVGGEPMPYRQSAVEQGNEPDAERRAEIERARLEALERELNPLHRRALERSHALARELGWQSYREMYTELKQIDLAALERQTARFLDETAAGYRERVEPHVRAQVGFGFERLRRSDLPYFFRARGFDALFPAEQIIPALEQTLAGLGIDLRAQANVHLDLEQRPSKSPRAFCAPVSVPDEVYLVIARHGGRDDYAALFHEAGHTEHYANVDGSLPFEFRYLGDNSVTEGFAFLFEHLTEDPAWLRSVLGAQDAERIAAYTGFTRASKFVFLRRYAAKLSYEMELHAGERGLDEMPALYSRELGDAVGVEWPSATYLSDVDGGYYAANYLRAWAFETHLRGVLAERFGPHWFAVPEAGDLLRALWREGQRLDADDLLAEVTGERLDFGVMQAEV